MVAWNWNIFSTCCARWLLISEYAYLLLVEINIPNFSFSIFQIGAAAGLFWDGQDTPFAWFDLVFEGVSSLLISPAKLNGAVLLEMNLRRRLETATFNCLNLICSYWGWWQNDEILSCFSCCSTHEAGKLICIF